VFAVLYIAIPDLMLVPFATDENAHVISMTRVLLRFVAFYSLLDSANAVFAFAIRGAGDTKFVSKIMTFLPWLGMVLPSWLALHYGWGVNWAWACATFYVCILAFIFYFRFRYGPWRSMRIIEPALADDERR
jgi:MATE family multidrug resistance protein